MDAPWWQTAVIYQIYPRSFADADGDGVGDLEGVRRRLDHLVWLGIDAIWLSPFFRSPMADFGYDVSDYCDVDPVFGTLDDFDRLLADAHDRGIKVLIDWVPNHSSDQHPWFIESRSSRGNPKRDWYVWRDSGPDGGPPNNWRRAFTGEARWERDPETGETRRVPVPPDPEADTAAWTWDEGTGQWYLHLFLPEQPDLSWDEPAVVDAMHDVLRFWLDRGVDGIRADVIHAIGKDPELRDDPPEQAALPHATTNDHPRTHELLRDLRSLFDSYPGDRMVVGEVYLLDTAKVAEYYGSGDELHLSFNFPPLYTRWRADAWRRRIEEVAAHVDPVGGWPTWVLSNHDNARHRTRYGTEARARAATLLLLTLRGTPFVYAGEELGLEDAVIPGGSAVDPGGRDGCRAPIPWTADPGHGWGPDPWLPFPPDAGIRSAAVQQDDPASVLHLYRRALAARRGSPALRLGTLELLPSAPGTLAWRRALDDDQRVVAVSFSDDVADLGVEGDWSVEVASDRDGSESGAEAPATIEPDTALLLRPA
ncbi:MAG: GH13_23 / GH13_30 / GH13_31 / GH13_17 / GH13_ 40 / GH13_29 / GH13 / GH13_16 / GH13_36 / GH13_35 / G H13_20 / GH13_4 / GH13_2 / GH13_34 / GH13_1 / GH13 _21 / GH13_19 [uncultured Acidimicrobiales bacterium]|uniref:GH13_23 / GH13_30 / GH13_31 / GH13_17 / GH13_ 40 / GH13_29 / GH13 / GH13_16 / GH13_36 / GH13_35 / G H13_20 / GH13_4 / GH13_2 / GH13_34 / GH13_1 / GH13 _21 / GH13_19 n=1 Tax=uncultured Acidimicrobiales bacterium TaxID=310071 RepID=A0A6J4ISC2_9ACTN|nr:MAG: GH13_23 / GH13_30 / GH13_31 / GH13_17 / GH13_ 40 / GH13_29 / GH13 / GH13_16 / GH13_36 / GH13_35 / G H13_20 / GH13_4 / GH13_2 / GH13_34 / GH13_1 / GH13 _21 / GH13_19 [uncultured Acidimicrobiales bacterium]